MKAKKWLPPEMVAQTQNFIEENRQLGYTYKEEFVRDAIRFRLTWLKGDNQRLEIPRDQFEKLNEALEEMEMPSTAQNNSLTAR